MNLRDIEEGIRFYTQRRNKPPRSDRENFTLICLIHLRNIDLALSLTNESLSYSTHSINMEYLNSPQGIRGSLVNMDHYLDECVYILKNSFMDKDFPPIDLTTKIFQAQFHLKSITAIKEKLHVEFQLHLQNLTTQLNILANFVREESE